MKFYARIEVTVKPEITDPEADTTLKSLEKLGYGEVNKVRRSTVYHMHLEVANETEARKRLEEMTQRLLVNPTMHDYSISLEKGV